MCDGGADFYSQHLLQYDYLLRGLSRHLRIGYNRTANPSRNCNPLQTAPSTVDTPTSSQWICNHIKEIVSKPQSRIEPSQQEHPLEDKQQSLLTCRVLSISLLMQ
jgi:hypothetical protein